MIIKRLYHFLGFGMLLVGLGLPVAAQDVIRLGTELEPPVLDPTRTASASAGEITWCNVFEGLTVIDGQGRLQPRLATGWTLSDDGLRYAFTLRKGVRFHDGRPFDAQTAAFSINRIIEPNSANPQKVWFGKIETAQAKGPDLLIIQLKRPDALLPFALALPAAVMVHPDTAADNGAYPVGTGPFRFADWKRGHSTRLERNDMYWGKKPALQRAEFIYMQTAAEKETLLAEGLVDGLVSVTALTNRFLIRPDFQMIPRRVEGKTLLAINNARPPFNDLRVRRALAHAIDRVRLSALYGPPFKPELIGSHFAPWRPGYINLVNRYPYDPARARALLRAAGVENGAPVTLKAPPTDYGRYGSLKIAADLEAVGFRVEVEPLDWRRWMSEVFEQKNYALTLIVHIEPMDLDIYARDDYYFNYNNKAFKAIWEQVLNARSESELLHWLGEAQRQVTEDAVNVFLYMLPELSLMHRRLTGFWEETPIPSIVLEDVRWIDP
ncbi:MAG: ABC transporter substrate-binding protein [Candidatus Competibacteraceae bacterium]|nr:ABC transporter substrate-binding protein [Candidatus Competibacteraceae bacterium]